jgi:hypothetical protein
MEPEMTDEEKKQKRHEAWKRWYEGPKGLAYRQRLKLERAGITQEQEPDPAHNPDAE